MWPPRRTFFETAQSVKFETETDGPVRAPSRAVSYKNLESMAIHY